MAPVIIKEVSMDKTERKSMKNSTMLVQLKIVFVGAMVVAVTAVQTGELPAHCWE